MNKLQSIISIFQDKYYFPKSSFIEWIQIGFNFNYLTIKMKNNKTIYRYKILYRSNISKIRQIFLNQDYESIGKFYNQLKKNKEIILIGKTWE